MQFGAGAWTFSKRTADILTTQENRWLRAIVGRERREEESWLRGLRRATREAQTLRAKLGEQSLPHRASGLTYGWWGHLARIQMGELEAPEPTAASLVQSWRDERWWRTAQHVGPGSTSLSEPWQHPFRNWPRGGEWVVARVLGESWKDAALDRQGWRRGRWKFVQVANERLQGPKMPK